MQKILNIHRKLWLGKPERKRSNLEDLSVNVRNTIETDLKGMGWGYVLASCILDIDH